RKQQQQRKQNSEEMQSFSSHSYLYAKLQPTRLVREGAPLQSGPLIKSIGSDQMPSNGSD
ncbi:hypothetical protein A2U01_0080991, partial [Trifolium medium]|nr:hypothetical protein [Trifolium medium]